MSLFFTFLIQLIATRIGTAHLAKLGIPNRRLTSPPRSDFLAEAERGESIAPDKIPATLSEEEISAQPVVKKDSGKLEPEKEPVASGRSSLVEFEDKSENDNIAAQLLAVGILEFGVLFHS